MNLPRAWGIFGLWIYVTIMGLLALVTKSSHFRDLGNAAFFLMLVTLFCAYLRELATAFLKELKKGK